ncbi:MAG: glycine betaine ABC transporter substrate-binding protein [Actinomycetes bacterium]
MTTAKTSAVTMTVPRWHSGYAGISRRLRVLVVGFSVLLVLMACADQESSNPTPSGSDESITVASFDFSENWILAEIYAQAMRRAGIPVEMLSNLGTREVVGPALEQGQVDFVVDYLGSALEAVDVGNPATHGSLEYARRELQKALVGTGVVVLGAAAAQDQNGFAVTRETAAGLSSRTISALSPTASSMVLGAPPECPDRPYCLIGLRSVYGLRFAHMEEMDTRAATATALESGEIDVGLLETTDAQLAGGQFVLLRDDKGLQPRENIVPLVRQQVIDEYGQDFADVIDSVTSRLTTADLIGLNRRVEIAGMSPSDVASDWLDSSLGS